jgi:hypothetical protein
MSIRFVAEPSTDDVGIMALSEVTFQASGALSLQTPYSTSDVGFLNWTQSADILFIGSPFHQPMELRRFGAAEFSLVPYDFQDGPYLPVNLTDTTLNPSSASGFGTLTANTTEGINGGQGFIQGDDEGRLVRIQTVETEQTKTAGDGSQTSFTFSFFAPDNDSIRVTLTNIGSGVIQNIAEGSTIEAIEGTDYTLNLNNPDPGGTVDFSISKAPATDIEVTIIRDISFWGWAEIVDVRSSTEVDYIVRSPSGLGSTSATKNWRLGTWSGNTGWPEVPTFHNERLVWGANSGEPQTLWMSKTADISNHAPTTPQGTVQDDGAINITLATAQVNAIRWLSSINSGLAVGTSGAEFLIRSATTTKPLAPTSVEAIRQTNRGSEAYIPPARVGLSTIFVQRGGEAVRELAFDFNVDGLQSRDFSLVSDHLLRQGVKDLAYQQNPDSVLWAVRSDGALLGFTLESDQEVFAWHAHRLGGSLNGGPPEVDSIASITTDAGEDRVYMTVVRTIDGSPKRTIEYLETPWHEDDGIENAFFLDSGLSGSFGTPTDTITGLDHLNGETVGVLADGAVHKDEVVQGGGIVLQRAVSTVQVGLKYDATVQTFPLDDGIRGGTTRGKVKRIHEAHVLFHETVGALLGQDQLDRIQFRDPSISMDTAVPPFTGMKSLRLSAQWDTLSYIQVKSDQPLPCTVLNIVGELEYSNR